MKKIVFLMMLHPYLLFSQNYKLEEQASAAYKLKDSLIKQIIIENYGLEWLDSSFIYFTFYAYKDSSKSVEWKFSQLEVYGNSDPLRLASVREQLIENHNFINYINQIYEFRSLSIKYRNNTPAVVISFLNRRGRDWRGMR